MNTMQVSLYKMTKHGLLHSSVCEMDVPDCAYMRERVARLRGLHVQHRPAQQHPRRTRTKPQSYSTVLLLTAVTVNITVVKKTFAWLEVLSKQPIMHLASSTRCKGVPDSRTWQRRGS